MIAMSLDFKEKFEAADAGEFLRLLFKDTAVRKTIPGIGSGGGDVSHTKLGASIMSMDFFDRIGESGMLGVGGSLRKCFDEYHDGVHSSDLLHESILNEDSEHHCVWSDEDRDEFIFRVFRALVVGGGLCQSEEDIHEYLRLTKEIYKDFVAVRKSVGTGKMQVASAIFAVDGVKDEDDKPGTRASAFPNDSPHSFCYIAVDPLKKSAKIWCMPWSSGW